MVGADLRPPGRVKVATGRVGGRFTLYNSVRPNPP